MKCASGLKILALSFTKSLLFFKMMTAILILLKCTQLT